METKIEKYYNESNEIEDLNGDYVKIEMPLSTYMEIKSILIDAKCNGIRQERTKKLIKLLNEAYAKGKTNWY